MKAKRPTNPERGALTTEQIECLRSHASTRVALKNNELFLLLINQGFWWARCQLAKSEKEKADEVRDAKRREDLALHARQFRDRLVARLDSEIPIWGSASVSLERFMTELNTVVRGVEAEAPRFTRGAHRPAELWRAQLIAQIDHLYMHFERNPEALVSRKHRNETIRLLLEFAGASVKDLKSTLRDARKLGVEPFQRLEGRPLRVVGES